MLASLMEAAGDIVVRLNHQGQILYASQRTIDLVNARRDLIGGALSELVCATERDALQAALADALATRQPSRIKLRIKAGDALPWFDFQLSAYAAPGDSGELLAVGRDVSSMHATEVHLRHLATHDGLTGLPNRALLSDRLRMAVAQARRSGHGFSVAALDLDGFKKVNDGLGHPTGDALLRVASARLIKALRNSDTLARIGGDEFVIIMPGAVSSADIKLVCGRMISMMQAPFEVQGHTLHVSASVGVAVYPEHGEDEVTLLAHADAAMYRAKETGKACCVVYDSTRIGQPEHDLSLEAAMFQAVTNGEFFLDFQPIVDARSRQIQGFETLMRWLRPGLGLVPPSRFIPIAETNGLINLLGAWALKASCVQLKSFQSVAKRPLYVSVNVSPRQFRQAQFLELLDQAIALSGIAGDQLLLEITEGTLMTDPLQAEAIMHKIVARKVRIAIDDFGTGYSSLAYLKRFPIAILKIDRAFIKDLPGSEKDAAICNAILSLAHHLQMSVVAEGVETEQQHQFLLERQCSYIQGYLTGKPMSPHSVLELLAATGIPARPVCAA
ncbi:MAG: sensor domain-containing phosphodiesterase [Oxalobacteraceae bacterium]|nr:sensor domain-containing phosphodiesterase [Oxalobacteraceae bacterium]